MEKRKPHYDLAAIQVAFADPSSLNRTYSSRQGADDLGMTDSDVLSVIRDLRTADFDKSMTSLADHRVWQDVYRPTVNGRELYVKVTVDTQQNYLLISFKEA